MSAALLEETDQAEARLLMHARHSDLVVLGRPHTDDLMPDKLIEAAEPHRSDSQAKPADILAKIAADVNADLLVVGGFGRAPLREAVFGGVTRALIEHAECPVLMNH